MKNLIGQQAAKDSSLCSAIAKQAADTHCGFATAMNYVRCLRADDELSHDTG